MKIGEEWHWCLWSANNNPLCRSARGYPDADTVLKAIRGTAKNFQVAQAICRVHET
jgi:hypothetical protein